MSNNRVTFLDKLPKERSFFGAYITVDKKGKKVKLYLDVPKIAGYQKQAKSWGYQGIVLTRFKDRFLLVEFGNTDIDFREKRKNKKATKNMVKMILSNSRFFDSLKDKYPIYWVLHSLYNVSKKDIEKAIKKLEQKINK